MLEIAELKISNQKQPLKHIKTLIFLVNLTLEKPPTTLGENQFESSSLFLKIAFLQWELFSKKSASKFTTYLLSRASQQSGNYSKQDSNKCCTTSVLCAEKSANCSSIFVQKSAFHYVLNQLYKSAQLLPWNVCQAAVSFSSLLRNLSCSLALLLPICSWKNEWPFPPFPPLI